MDFHFVLIPTSPKWRRKETGKINGFSSVFFFFSRNVLRSASVSCFHLEKTGRIFLSRGIFLLDKLRGDIYLLKKCKSYVVCVRVLNAREKRTVFGELKELSIKEISSGCWLHTFLKRFAFERSLPNQENWTKSVEIYK